MNNATTTPRQSGTSVVRCNPTPRSDGLGADHGQLRTGVSDVLTIAGQGPTGADGALLHAGDPAAQLALALANMIAVLGHAGMGLGDVAHLRVHTPDLDAVLAVYDTVTEHLAAHDATPPTTVVEVARLALPGSLVELDALAIR